VEFSGSLDWLKGRRILLIPQEKGGRPFVGARWIRMTPPKLAIRKWARFLFF
jgi:hypothetical protein